MIAVSMAMGYIVTDYPPKYKSLQSESLINFLDKCLVEEDRLRWTVTALLEHEFIKVQTYIFLITV